MRVIEKDKLFKYIPKPKNDIEADYYCEIADTITDLPEYIIDDEVTDVQPVKRGRWEEREGYGGWGDTYYHCSVCGSDWVFEEGTPKANEWNFCPHCGADMRGDENG